ncbi:LysR substrate-binding domain-containing protein [Neisseriaceae bacterium TC5R-5]|nr:LysR substrate-binding domain-containing protein [Neisseriaceae bacterium TC5R-5]
MRKLPSLNALRVFEEVACHRSFNRAAVALNVTQGAVSRQIRQLEQDLGVALFVRTPQGLAITEAGGALALPLRAAFDAVEQALQAVQGKNLRQHLQILAPPTWANRCLSPRLRSFCQSYPQLSLSVTTQLETNALSSIDCEIRFGLQASATGESRLLVYERHVAVASPTLLIHDMAEALMAFPLLHILHEGQRLPVWKNWLQQAIHWTVDNAQGLEFSTLEQVIQACCAGVGLAVVDRQMVAQELADGRLRQISPAEVEGPYAYWLDIPANRQGWLKVEKFASWLCD